MKGGPKILATAIALSWIPSSKAFETDGVWNAVGLGTPSSIEISTVTNEGVGPAISELHNIQHFEIFTETLNVSGGVVSGAFDGTLTVNESGLVTIVDDETANYRINWSSDTMVGLDSDGPAQELEILVKQPASTVFSDIVGNWNIAGLCTPSGPTVFKGFNEELEAVIVTAMTQGDNFDYLKGTISITGKGTYAGTLGPESMSGTITVTGPGVVTATDSEPGEIPFTMFLNASKNLMVAVVADGVFHELLVLVRGPSGAAIHEMQGSWSLASFNLPARLVLSGGGSHFSDLEGRTRFEADSGRWNVRSDGAYSQSLDGEREQGLLELPSTCVNAAMDIVEGMVQPEPVHRFQTFQDAYDAVEAAAARMAAEGASE